MTTTLFYRVWCAFTIVLGSLLLPGHSGAQSIESKPFEALSSLQRQEAKNVIVYIHTEWCTYCKVMEQTTFKNKKIIQQLNNDFYFVALDAEEDKSIHFNNHTFKFKPTGKGVGMQELALALGSIDGETAYPTLTVLSPDYEIIFQHSGLMRPKELKTLLDRLEKPSPSEKEG